MYIFFPQLYKFIKFLLILLEVIISGLFHIFHQSDKGLVDTIIEFSLVKRILYFMLWTKSISLIFVLTTMQAFHANRMLTRQLIRLHMLGMKPDPALSAFEVFKVIDIHANDYNVKIISI